MRITEAARALGISPRMLRYRDALGLAPAHRTPADQVSRHRSYDDHDLDTIELGLEIEQRYDITPAALAFGLRVLADPNAAATVRELGERLGHISPLPTQAELDRERALRWLGRSGMAPSRLPHS